MKITRKSDSQIMQILSQAVSGVPVFAKEIMNMAKINCEVGPVEAYQYPTLTLGPHYRLL